MADYASTSVVVRYGEVSDYSDNLLNRGISYNSTTAAYLQGPLLINVTNVAYTIELGAFTTIQCVVISNKSSSVDVEVRYTSLAPVSGSWSNKQLLTAGRVIVLPTVTVSADLVLITNASTAECEVIIYGT